MNRYWLSWIQPTEDHRPLTDPPNKAILGWWCSGYDQDDNATLCAGVEAKSERSAKAAVQIDWPEAKLWRFCEAKTGRFYSRGQISFGWMGEGTICRAGHPAMKDRQEFLVSRS